MIAHADRIRRRVPHPGRRYRITYSVEGRRLLVITLKLGHRKDVYR